MCRRIVIIVLFVGCSSDVDVAIEDIDTALKDAICDREVRCGQIESLEWCRAVVSEFDDFLDLQHAVANGTVDYDGGQMKKCVDWYTARSCDRTAESARVAQESCNEAIRGTVPDGGTCMISAQCVSQHCDNPSCPMACCEGTCEPATPRVPIGSSCMPGTINCVADSFCNGRVCQALLSADQPCVDNLQCGFGLFCPSDSGRCTPARHRGDPCPEGRCHDDGTTCDAGQVCVARARRGEVCDANVVCQQPNLCNPATLICEPPPEIGQMCIRSCQPGAYCDDATGRCAATKPNGQACSLSSECTSNQCDDTAQTCQDKPVCV